MGGIIEILEPLEPFEPRSPNFKLVLLSGIRPALEKASLHTRIIQYFLSCGKYEERGFRRVEILKFSGLFFILNLF